MGDQPFPESVINMGQNTHNARPLMQQSLYRYLMVKTTAALFSLRQQKSTLANRSSPGQPITTSNKKLGSV